MTANEFPNQYIMQIEKMLIKAIPSLPHVDLSIEIHLSPELQNF